MNIVHFPDYLRWLRILTYTDARVDQLCHTFRDICYVISVVMLISYRDVVYKFFPLKHNGFRLISCHIGSCLPGKLAP